MEQQFFTSTLTEKERDTENILRPKTLADYVGQEKVKDNLSVYIKAALARGESLDHVLLYGPPGLGKTTLAHIIANEMGVPITVTSGSAIPGKFDLSAILSKLKPNEVLFIDEIHRLNSSLEEILYPAMEDYRLDFVVGKGPSATSVNIKLEKFTLIGATTKAGNLASPLRDRFGVLQGITDREYFTNSFHVPVFYPIRAWDKIQIEANYHKYCLAGAISYIEVAEDLSPNIDAFETIVTAMADSDMGYFSINHPVDRDPVCGYVGIIGDTCPRCGRHAFDTIAFEQKIRKRLLSLDKDITVAIMGCLVNGPGEAKGADYAVTGMKDKVYLYRKGKLIGSVSSDEAEEALFEAIGNE